jgi:DNA repair protein RecO (recombination protein O)
MFAGMLDRLLEERQPHPELYDVLLEALHALDEDGDGSLIELWFKLRLVSQLGYRPDLTACSICGEHSGDANYYFSPERGGILDETCRDASSRAMSAETIKLWRLLLDHPYATMSRITGARQIAAGSLVDCDEFYQYHLGRAFSPDMTGA